MICIPAIVQQFGTKYFVRSTLSSILETTSDLTCDGKPLGAMAFNVTWPSGLLAQAMEHLVGSRLVAVRLSTRYGTKRSLHRGTNAKPRERSDERPLTFLNAAATILEFSQLPTTPVPVYLQIDSPVDFPTFFDLLTSAAGAYNECSWSLLCPCRKGQHHSGVVEARPTG